MYYSAFAHVVDVESAVRESYKGLWPLTDVRDAQRDGDDKALIRALVAEIRRSWAENNRTANRAYNLSQTVAALQCDLASLQAQ
jgi:hypothetical protein